MKITPGKVKGLTAVSNSRGVIAAAAMDQRGSLQKSLAKERGVAEVPLQFLKKNQRRPKAPMHAAHKRNLPRTRNGMKGAPVHRFDLTRYR